MTNAILSKDIRYEGDFHLLMRADSKRQRSVAELDSVLAPSIQRMPIDETRLDLNEPFGSLYTTLDFYLRCQAEHSVVRELVFVVEEGHREVVLAFLESIFFSKKRYERPPHCISIATFSMDIGWIRRGWREFLAWNNIMEQVHPNVFDTLHIA